MAMYVQKLMVVDAMQVTMENLDEVAQWCSGRKVGRTIQVPEHGTARVGDWISITERGTASIIENKTFQDTFTTLDE